MTALNQIKNNVNMNNLPNGTLLKGGKYRLVRFIGSGGFGYTYEAINTTTQQHVAIKELFLKDVSDRDEHTLTISAYTTNKSILLQKVTKKFLEEADALKSMSHPNIVRVHESFEENGTAYYVMDYIDGKSLHEIIKQNGALSEQKSLKYIKQVAEALAYVHGKNRLHLDIKPSNVMIDTQDNAILIDFGVSKQYDEANGENTSTLIGKSPGYSPVEQLGNNIHQFSPATDIYALGATLYKCITGNTPPDATTVLSEGLPMLPSAISAKVRRTIIQSMEPIKTNRPQSIDEFKKCLTDNLSTSPNPIPEPKPKVSNNSNKFLWVSIAIVVIGIAIYFISQSNDDSVSDPIATVSPQTTITEPQIQNNTPQINTQQDVLHNENTAEIRYIFDKYNKDISEGYSGNWGTMNKIDGVKKIENTEGQIYSIAIKYEGVLYMNNSPIVNTFNEPQNWYITLEGPRAGAYCIELACEMLGWFEDDCVRYLQNMGCKYLRGGEATSSWYKVYSYKKIYIIAYCSGGGNGGNYIGYFLVQDSSSLSDVERHVKDEYMF